MWDGIEREARLIKYYSIDFFFKTNKEEVLGWNQWNKTTKTGSQFIGNIPDPAFNCVSNHIIKFCYIITTYYYYCAATVMSGYAPDSYIINYYELR